MWPHARAGSTFKTGCAIQMELDGRGKELKKTQILVGRDGKVERVIMGGVGGRINMLKFIV